MIYRNRPLKVTINSHLPVGMGLGSSAAYSVALVAALFDIMDVVFGNEEEKKRITNAWAFQAERIMHGTPSGIDNSISTFGIF